jgi:hypothetical protein
VSARPPLLIHDGKELARGACRDSDLVVDALGPDAGHIRPVRTLQAGRALQDIVLHPDRQRPVEGHLAVRVADSQLWGEDRCQVGAQSLTGGIRGQLEGIRRVRVGVDEDRRSARHAALADELEIIAAVEARQPITASSW